MRSEMTMDGMTMRVTLRNLAADGGITDILSKPLNLRDRGSVLESMPANGNGRAYERLAVQERLSARLERMSLSELLYFVLAGEGMVADEPI
ncbi:MAG: hypothetical protein WBY53_16150 [Acidobacteriaceae bacterium]